MTTLIKNARILAMDDDFTEYENADILVEGTKISAVGKNLTFPDGIRDVRVIDASNMLAMPGLVNAHIHTPGNLMKGNLDNLPLEIFMLYEVPPLSDTPPAKSSRTKIFFPSGPSDSGVRPCRVSHR